MRKRPLPPADLTEPAEYQAEERFVPAPELATWLRVNFIDRSGPLYNPAHDHLQDALISCLWTNVPLRKQQRDVAATAEMPSAQGGRWARAKFNQQLREWFGVEPHFLITFYAPDSAERDDWEFCGLSRHELLHCGQSLDRFGAPRFDKDGAPIFAIVGHEVEEFPLVAEEFGIGACAGRSRDLVRAAQSAPSVTDGRIAEACGPNSDDT